MNTENYDVLILGAGQAAKPLGQARSAAGKRRRARTLLNACSEVIKHGKSNSQVMPRVRKVEALVAEREIRDLVALHCQRQALPVVERRIGHLVPANLAAISATPFCTACASMTGPSSVICPCPSPDDGNGHGPYVPSGRSWKAHRLECKARRAFNAPCTLHAPSPPHDPSWPDAAMPTTMPA